MSQSGVAWSARLSLVWCCFSIAKTAGTVSGVAYHRGVLVVADCGKACTSLVAMEARTDVMLVSELYSAGTL